eukprot:NODE_5_length_72347_cov_1.339331.p52 type:complete len:128 gc:universal NODE_5_length_72347_cov_1.339331:12835-12452(-)
MSRFSDIVDQLKKKPGRHLTAFLILHELTAIFAFPVVYPLASFSNRLLLTHLPESLLEKTQLQIKKANYQVNRIRQYFGYDPLDDHHPVVLNFALSYVYVKILMPLRIGLSLWLSPIAVKAFTRNSS